MKLIKYVLLYQIGLQNSSTERKGGGTAITIGFLCLLLLLMPILTNWFYHLLLGDTAEFRLNEISLIPIRLPPVYEVLLNKFYWFTIRSILGSYILWAIFSKLRKNPPSYSKLYVSFTPALIPPLVLPELLGHFNSSDFLILPFGSGLWSITVLTVELHKQYALSVRKAIWISIFSLIALFLGYAGLLGFGL